jgi:thioredoxin reductase (NADPH)
MPNGLVSLSEERLTNRGVSACAVCDGFFFRGQEKGLSEVEILLLKKPSIFLNCVQGSPDCQKRLFASFQIMAQRVMDNPKIEVHFNTETIDVIGEEEVTGALFRNNQTHEEFEVPVKGFFVAIGHKPNTDIFKDYIELKEGGYIKTIPGSAATNVEGVYAAGDVQDNVYRQAITSAGTGCMAALEAEKYLVNKGIE